MRVLRKQKFENISFKYQILLFSFIFLLIMGVIAANFSSWYIGQSKQEFASNLARESLSLQIYQNEISKEYDSVIADLNILGSLPLLESTESPIENAQIKNKLQKIYLKFAEMRQRYHQIRYLDNDGNEVIRINYENGIATTVADNELQPKQDRYYVKEINQLESGQIYVSPFDLNIEYNVIEAPFRPMIRLGKRLFDKNNMPQGMLIINYEGKFVLDLLEHQHSVIEEDSKLMLLNKDGYWLKASKPEFEWGFMFERKKELTYKVLYPDVWQAIQKSTSGQYENANGLYTFLKFDPLRPSQLSKENMSNQQTLITTKENKSATWILISYLPKENYYHSTHETLQQNSPYFVLLILSSFVVAYLLARNQLERQKLINRNHFLANHDTLTGLYNRAILDHQLPKKLLEATQTNQSCCIYYLDLDNFKPINDTYGHNVGDEVLKLVALRLQGISREDDDLVIRLGGDEILIIICGLNSDLQRSQYGIKLLNLFKSSLHVNQNSLRVSASIGCATYPRDSSDLDKLINMADAALYYAKKERKGSLKMFSELSDDMKEKIAKSDPVLPQQEPSERSE
ncbi:GGDEF domain-containing protein [Thiosulfatimonas sediminis]|uniref:GGDEF domain-containing protein n=1 Tax=Thiosulfatimonas sediminis TaxID=2675054 RepID=A0A6F8PVF9_9GAMM|nr:sensor domain-containing diguanylate cyclase [Thiosulfatimonas sediminis]BBP46123.1 GGDEF domain-containing protein [Thiosulfatimonas sediminis]